MFKTIDEYLDTLETEMKDADPALVQDALSDAREHLSLALEATREKNSDVSEADALKAIVEEYGTPEETASAYREIERRTSPALKPAVKSSSVLGRFFGIFTDPKAWGALLYMLIALPTGIIYFTWAVTGFLFSLTFAIFVFGLIIAAFFIVSLRGLALLEGRVVEGLLGVRMPRRPLFVKAEGNWWTRLKTNLLDWQIWRMFLYMFLQMPIGLIYFSIVVILLALSLALIAAPILQTVIHFPFVVVGETQHFISGWEMPFWALAGFLLWTVTMHIGRGIGWLHGKYAKWMLVS